MAATNVYWGWQVCSKILRKTYQRVSLKIYDRILLEAIVTSIMLAGLFLLTKQGSKSFKNKIHLYS